jgi:hypothetical protein
LDATEGIGSVEPDGVRAQTLCGAVRHATRKVLDRVRAAGCARHTPERLVGDRVVRRIAQVPAAVTKAIRPFSGHTVTEVTGILAKHLDPMSQSREPLAVLLR